MQKIYGAYGHVFPDDRVLCHLVMYKMKYSFYQDSSVIKWLVCSLLFWLRRLAFVEVIGNPISDVIVFKNELTYLPLFEA